MSTTASIPASLQGRHCNQIDAYLRKVGRSVVGADTTQSALGAAGDRLHPTNDTGVLGSAQLSFRDTAHSYMATMEAAERIPYGANAHFEAHAEERANLPSRLSMTGTCNWLETVPPNSEVGQALQRDADAASGASTIQASAFSSR